MPVTTRSQTNKFAEQNTFYVLEPSVVEPSVVEPSVVEQSVVEPSVVGTNINLDEDNNIINKLKPLFISTINDLIEITEIFDKRKEMYFINGFNKEAKHMFYEKVRLLTLLFCVIEQIFPRVYNISVNMNELGITIYEKIHELYNEIHNLDENKKPTTMEEREIINIFKHKLIDVEKMITCECVEKCV